jgi:hypothetical protein
MHAGHYVVLFVFTGQSHTSPQQSSKKGDEKENTPASLLSFLQSPVYCFCLVYFIKNHREYSQLL